MTHLRTYSAAVILLVLFTAKPIFSATSDAPETASKSYEYFLGFGPMLPSRITGVTEIMNGWGTGITFFARKGTFEANFFNGIGSGQFYRSLIGSYRIDFKGDGALSALPIFFMLGFQADQYVPTTGTSKVSGGWHYGGGLRIQLNQSIDLRAQFQHRFSPGQSLIVLVGTAIGF